VFLPIGLNFSATKKVDAFLALVFFKIFVVAIGEVVGAAEIVLDESFADEIAAVGLGAAVSSGVDGSDSEESGGDDGKSKKKNFRLHFFFFFVSWEREKEKEKSLKE
jgi:hypothetical protein